MPAVESWSPGNPLKLGPRHASKLVTVVIEDTCFRVLHGEEGTLAGSATSEWPMRSGSMADSAPVTGPATEARSSCRRPLPQGP
jgi:hypothetical protein